MGTQCENMKYLALEIFHVLLWGLKVIMLGEVN